MNDFRKTLWLNIGLTTAGILTLTFLTIWLGFDISKRTVQIQIQKKELLERTQAVESLASLKNDFAKAKNFFDALNNVLPAKDELVSFPKDMENFAKSSKIDLGFAFSGETKAAEKEPGTIAFNLSLSGGYDNFVSFLKSVEASRFFVGFNSFDLNLKAGNYAGLVVGQVFSR